MSELFKGLTPALLLITVIGMVLGILAYDRVSDTLSGQQEDTRISDEGASSIILLPEAGADSEQSTSVDEATAVDAEHQNSSEVQTTNEDSLHQTDLEELEAKLTTWEAGLHEWESELRKLEGSLRDWEARLVKQADSLQATADYLTEQLAALQKERDLLAQGWEGLRAGQVRLDDEWIRLREAQSLLRAKEADVAKREHEARSLWRLSVAILSLGILAGLLSIVFLLTLARRWQRVLGKITESTPSPNDNSPIKKNEPRFTDRIRFKQPAL